MSKVKVVVKFYTPDDKREKALPLFKELVRLIPKQPGYVLAEILRKRDEPNAFLFLTTWVSLGDWERWIKSEARNKIVKKMDYIEERSIEVWDYGFLDK